MSGVLEPEDGAPGMELMHDTLIIRHHRVVGSGTEEDLSDASYDASDLPGSSS